MLLFVGTVRKNGQIAICYHSSQPGGRFEQGSAGVSLYNGSYIANHSSVIVVTTNYRLGAL